MVLWGTMSLPSTPTCPHEEPWEAQEKAHTSQGPESGVATRLKLQHQDMK
jgi:hypothetical protein